jgi:hypothetical protein
MVPAEPHGGWICDGCCSGVEFLVGWEREGEKEFLGARSGMGWDGMGCGDFDVEGLIRLFPEVKVMYLL